MLFLVFFPRYLHFSQLSTTWNKHVKHKVCTLALYKNISCSKVCYLTFNTMMLNLCLYNVIKYEVSIGLILLGKLSFEMAFMKSKLYLVYTDLIKVNCKAGYPTLNHSFQMESISFYETRFKRREKPDLSLYAKHLSRKHLVPFL